jgi:hypothetical protein
VITEHRQHPNKKTKLFNYEYFDAITHCLVGPCSLLRQVEGSPVILIHYSLPSSLSFNRQP